MAMEPGEFYRLLELHQRMVFSIALRLTGVRETAEEVAQNVFLELTGRPSLSPRTTTALLASPGQHVQAGGP